MGHVPGRLGGKMERSLRSQAGGWVSSVWGKEGVSKFTV